MLLILELVLYKAIIFIYFSCLLQVDDQSDIGSEQDGPDDSDDDAHNDNKRKPGANPHNDLNCHDSAHDNVNDSNSNDNETDHRKEEGEKRQSVNEHGVNINTRTRAGAEDKIRNGTCRKRSDEDLSEEVYGRRTDKVHI